MRRMRAQEKVVSHVKRNTEKSLVGWSYRITMLTFWLELERRQAARSTSVRPETSTNVPTKQPASTCTYVCPEADQMRIPLAFTLAVEVVDCKTLNEVANIVFTRHTQSPRVLPCTTIAMVGIVLPVHKCACNGASRIVPSPHRSHPVRWPAEPNNVYTNCGHKFICFPRVSTTAFRVSVCE